MATLRFADEIDDDFERQCTVLARLGIRNIELRSAWGVNVLDLDDDFEAHLRRHDSALRRADQLGAPYIRLFSFFIPEGQDPDGYRDVVLRRMAALAGRAEGRARRLPVGDRGRAGDRSRLTRLRATTRRCP